ncbi:hypothetical protein PRIPAC_89566 [Pristionchus pacificus]|uniref:Membrane transporter n=1 Tax=Pristionchus pacificus TaxID=54126 RepID=A0A2A6B7C1_PRIPA|nr:hypothetical protein PRIPAC_89566 [Pristionchus pacificus]|eukprot:PDM61789.1 membrane transporter [Pristionchus pacificus]
MLEAARRKPSRTEEKSGLLVAVAASDLSTPSSDAASQRPLSTVSPATTRADAQLLMQETEDSESISVDEDDSKKHRIVEGKEGSEPATNWIGITWCAVVYFFIATALQALNCVSYMYLTHTGHATGVVLFSVYAYSAKCFKKPLLIGHAVSFLAFGLYLCIMLFPAPARRYVFLIAFFFQSFAEGSSIVLRTYVPRVSSKTDRQAAYGVVSGAMMFSILGGPLIQMAASAPPDWKPLHWLEFINYTYCIYLALLLGIVATVIICTKLTEPAPIKDADEESFSEKMATALTELRSMDKVLMAFLFFERIVTSVTFSALLGAFIPYMQMIVHGDHTKNTLFISGSQACAGATSITAVGLIIFSPAKKIRSSCILFISLTCYAFLYLYSYPWAPISEPITVWSEANPHACNTTQLEWCAQQSHVKLWYWLPPICLLFGLAVPTAMISIDTVYSKMLGNIDQNLMQGALELVNDLASAIAPVITLKIYTDHGPATFWLVLSGVAIVGFLFWLPMIPKMRRLKM